jgi:hypothetical protein
MPVAGIGLGHWDIKGALLFVGAGGVFNKFKLRRVIPRSLLHKPRPNVSIVWHDNAKGSFTAWRNVRQLLEREGRSFLRGLTVGHIKYSGVTLYLSPCGILRASSRLPERVTLLAILL